MKIDTDRIKNKQFAMPIKPELVKHSQEYRALAILRYLFPNRFEKMVTGDAPDLQDKENDIGIEVTAAVDQRDMQASREFVNFQQKNKNAEKHKDAIIASGYSFLPIHGDKFAICTFGTSDEEKVVFQESIRKKLEKFQRYKAKFKKIGIAVILPEIPTSDAEGHFCEWITEVLDESDTSFDFVYVLSHRFCIYYDVQKNAFEKRTLTDTEIGLLLTIARMTAEGEISLSDIEWQ